MKKNSLIKKLKEKEALIAIIGLGYVGLPLSLTYAEKGYKVIGFDIDENKVNLINDGKSYIHHINNERIASAIKRENLYATNDFSEAKNVDALILCVPTPLNKFREPDLSFIRATLKSLYKYFKKGQILSLESTTYPGTTEEELKPIVESKDLSIGEDFFLIYSPEREDPGNQTYNTQNIPKVVGGCSSSCLEVGKALYEQIIDKIIPVSSTKTAEMTKLLENIHRAVNIGLMNELKPLADQMGVDLYEVIAAAATKPFGFVPYYPGPGLGGHCIPIDPFYLTWKAREYDMHTRFIELAGEINSSMPNYVVQKTIDALNNNTRSLRGSRILIIGLSYKKNVDDMRESPSVELIHILKLKGALVDYSDPYIKVFPSMRKYKFNLKNIEVTKESLTNYDATIIATDHDNFDYELIKTYSSIIVDTRGRYKPNGKIYRA